MSTPILQNLLKIIISLLLALVPFYTLLAQSKPKKEAPKTVRVKMFKSVDGKLIYSKDTVINAADHEKQLKALRSVEFDAKTWKQLEPSKIFIDSLKESISLRMPTAISYSTHLDTAALRKKGVKLYKMDRTISEEEKAMLFERINGATGDSFLLKALKDEKIMFLNTDSSRVRHFKELKFEGGSGKAFSIVHAGPGSDSAHVMISISRPEGLIIRDGNELQPGEVTARYTTSEKIKIETDESGKTTVYEIDAKGNKKEIDAYHFGKTGEKATVILLRKSKVEAITKEDKKALKEAGVKVEKSSKKELKIENLSYYPNPSNGRFNISFTLLEEQPASVRVLNSVGKEIYLEKIANPKTLFEKQIDISNYGKGTYYLQVEQGGKTLTKRLLVQ